MNQVDLSQLAVDRVERNEASTRLKHRANVMTRFVLPGALVLGFLALIGWASRDFLIPPRDVQVIPVHASQTEVRSEGTPLFNAAGWIEPRPTAIRVAALAEGVVEKLLVVEDQVIEVGQPIAQLIKDDARLIHERTIADRKLAEAELDRAKASLVAATTRFEQPVHLEAMLAQADAALAKINTELKNLPHETSRAQSNLKFNLRDYQRNVSAGTGVSQREVDQAKTDYETMKAMLAELKGRESSLKKEVAAIDKRREALNIQLQLLADETKAKDESNAMVRAAEARVEQMKVAEAEAELRLNRMTVRAPASGKVFRLFGLPGARVGSGVMTAMDGHDSTSVITMYQPESLQIRVDVRFEDIPKVSLAQPVEINNPGLPDPIMGSVLFVSSEADIQKNTLQVKVKIESAVDLFKPEMLVDVTFLAPKQVDSPNKENETELRLYLPEEHVRQDEGDSIVWVADQSAGVARRRTVELGSSSIDGLVEIENGLDVSSRIIVGNTEGLKDRQRIRVTGEGE